MLKDIYFYSGLSCRPNQYNMIIKMQEEEIYKTDSEVEEWVNEDDEEGEVDEDNEEELLGKRKASPSPEPERKKTCRRPSV